jgi:hypothetical protein
MNEPKQHHYVHESYLENFCDESGSIHVFDKRDKGSQFVSAPKKVLKQGYYYSQPVHSEERFDISLENLFSEIETDWPSIVN